MNRFYEDLLGLTESKPSFFQKHGVPRWGALRPGESNGVYAREIAIAEISCQSCDMRFHVLMESRQHEASLSASIREGTLHYGDPPNVDCCAAGPSMNSEVVKVIEFWSRGSLSQWERDSRYEVAFRRFGDPWTDEMKDRARRAIDDPERHADERSQIKEALEFELARPDKGDIRTQPVEYASEFIPSS